MVVISDFLCYYLLLSLKGVCQTFFFQTCNAPLSSLCLRLSTSRTHGDKQAIWFTLGIREVIKGWDKGLQDMCSGEKRKLVIPPALAYGKEGRGTDVCPYACQLHCMLLYRHMTQSS